MPYKSRTCECGGALTCLSTTSVDKDSRVKGVDKKAALLLGAMRFRRYGCSLCDRRFNTAELRLDGLLERFVSESLTEES